tara:strand:+ start:395 stop:859 length:465 start_codon:yes stop_codon:yes gene_type:complete
VIVVASITFAADIVIFDPAVSVSCFVANEVNTVPELTKSVDPEVGVESNRTAISVGLFNVNGVTTVIFPCLDARDVNTVPELTIFVDAEVGTESVKILNSSGVGVVFNERGAIGLKFVPPADDEITSFKIVIPVPAVNVFCLLANEVVRDTEFT